LYNNARAKAVQAKFDDLAKQKVEAEGKSANSYKGETLGGKIANFFGQDNVDFKNREELNAYIIKTFSKQLNVRKDKQSGLLKYDKKIFEILVESYLHRTGLDIKEAEIQDIDSRMKLLEEELAANTVKDLGKKDTTDSTKSTYNVPSGSEDKNKAKKEKQFKTLEEMAKERLDFETKTDEELLKLQRQFEDDNLAVKQDGYTKDLALENERYQREIQDLEKQKVHKEEMAKLDVEIAKAKKAGDSRYYDFLIQLKKDWQSKNEKLDDQINKIQEGKLYIHNLKIASIEDKAAKDYITKAKEKFDAEKTIRETEYYNQLAALGTNEKAKTKLKKEFEQNELAHQEVFLKELLDKFNIIIGKGHLDKIDLSLLTPEQVLEFQKEAEKVGLTLAELIEKRNSLSANEKADNLNKLGLKGSTDIFGFTPDNWDALFKNLETGKVGINEMVFAVSALSDMYSKYSSFLDANENRQLKQFEQASDKKKTRLKKQLDSGYISQDQYNKAVEKIDKSLEKEKAELDYKQAKRQKAIAAMNVITSTAQAIIGIWAQVPKFDFGATAAILSGVVGALGALQLATVLKTPLPARGAQEGYYPNLVKREQDGKTFTTTGTSPMKSGLFTKPRLLVGEGPGDMPEMVIDKKAYSQISPETKNALLRELKGIKGFENGYYNPSAMRFETPANSIINSSASSSDNLLHLVLNVVQENTLVMKDLRDKGVVGKFLKNDLKSAKDMQDMIDDYNTLRNSNKK
jgi:tubulin-specific chaperone A